MRRRASTVRVFGVWGSGYARRAVAICASPSWCAVISDAVFSRAPSLAHAAAQTQTHTQPHPATKPRPSFFYMYKNRIVDDWALACRHSRSRAIYAHAATQSQMHPHAATCGGFPAHIATKPRRFNSHSPYPHVRWAAMGLRPPRGGASPPYSHASLLRSVAYDARQQTGRFCLLVKCR